MMLFESDLYLGPIPLTPVELDKVHVSIVRLLSKLIGLLTLNP